MRKLFCTLLLTILCVCYANAQTTVTGVVKDDTGELLPGASVIVKGSNGGAMTDINGKFSLKVENPSTAILKISYIGMKSFELPLNGKTSGISVQLESNASQLDELVVIGYGGSKVRANLTGSVGSVSGTALARVPVASAAEALTGKIAGVQVSSVDGAPGSEINIRVRGGTSVTQSNSPLFIVDGFPVSSINDIPPTDIQSIDVLKDASLTAIYGSKGANGVVIVTTKSARSGKIQATFNHTTQLRTLARKIELMNPYEFVKMQYDGVVGDNTKRQKFRGNFGNPLDFDLYKRYDANDWQDEILGGTPISQMYNLTLGGGSENLKFNTSITHNDEQGVLIGSGVIRTGINSKVSADLSKNTKLLINQRFNYRQNKGAGADAVGGGGIIDVLRYRPTNGLREFAHVALEDIDPEEEKYFQYTNPKGDIDQNYNVQNSYDFTNQASFEWNILKGLNLRVEGMHNLSFADNNRFWGYITSTGRSNNNQPVAEIANTFRNRYQVTNVLSYGFDRGENNFSVLLGQEFQSSQTRTMVYSTRYFSKDIKPNIALQNMGLGTPWKSTSNITSPDRSISYFGQANYDYAHKYLLSFTMRANGSTKFAPGNQWGYFPAVSGAWIMTKENFMADQVVFSLLKLRMAVGKAGNNRINNDMWRYQYVINTTGGPGFGEVDQNGSEYYANSGGNTFPNTKIKWETTLTRNFAIDLGLFNDRITITPEVYWNTTTDLLYQSNIPITSGYTQQMQNIGQVTNRGVELTINADIIKTKDFQLKGNFTFGSNKTRIDKLNGTEDVIWTSSSRWSSSSYDYCLKVGDQLGLIYGYVYDGIYGFNEFDATNNYGFTPKAGTVNNNALFGTAPGKPKFKNFVDGVDGPSNVNIVNENDRVVIGNTNPDFTGGFGLNSTWKSFDFSCNFNYMYGFNVNNATRYTLSSFENNTNNYYNILPEFNADKRWRYSNDNGDRMLNNALYVQQYIDINSKATTFNPSDIGKKVTHSYFIEDGSFLRLQDITFGYTFPKKLMSKVGLNNLRLYFSGYNLFILTNYTGYDPEVNVQSGLTPSVDYNRYPRSRNYVFGLNLTF
ncbi:MAG: TonB-dependent receptor [Paludibacter sp.]